VGGGGAVNTLNCSLQAEADGLVLTFSFFLLFLALLLPPETFPPDKIHRRDKRLSDVPHLHRGIGIKRVLGSTEAVKNSVKGLRSRMIQHMHIVYSNTPPPPTHTHTHTHAPTFRRTTFR